LKEPKFLKLKIPKISKLIVLEINLNFLSDYLITLRPPFSSYWRKAGLFVL
jgi:hypothetical protein